MLSHQQNDRNYFIYVMKGVNPGNSVVSLFADTLNGKNEFLLGVASFFQIIDLENW